METKRNVNKRCPRSRICNPTARHVFTRRYLQLGIQRGAGEDVRMPPCSWPTAGRAAGRRPWCCSTERVQIRRIRNTWMQEACCWWYDLKREGRGKRPYLLWHVDLWLWFLCPENRGASCYQTLFVIYISHVILYYWETMTKQMKGSIVSEYFCKLLFWNRKMRQCCLSAVTHGVLCIWETKQQTPWE